MLVAAHRWGPIGRTGNTNAAITINRLYVMPCLVPYGTLVTKISTRCTTLGASSNVRMGIYHDNNGRPGPLMLDAGTLLTDTTGLKEITISQTMMGNPYWNIFWLACVFNGTAPAMNCNSVAMDGGMGIDSSSATSAPFTGFYRAFTYAALPTVESESAWTAAVTAIVPTILLG